MVTTRSKTRKAPGEEDETAPPPLPPAKRPKPQPQTNPHHQQQTFFLLKAEPESRIVNGTDVRFSITDLCARGAAGEPWSGVRNAEASKTMRERMHPGDLAFFYHSNCKSPGIAGIMRVQCAGYPDASAFDPADPYFDAKSEREKPRWWCVNVEYVRHLERFISLEELKGYTKEGGHVLGEMQLLKRPQLSVQIVRREEWEFILGLEGG